MKPSASARPNGEAPRASSLRSVSLSWVNFSCTDGPFGLETIGSLFISPNKIYLKRATRETRCHPGYGRVHAVGVANPRDKFRDEGLTAAFEQAIAGNRAPLFDKLRRVSGLPGPRVNAGLLQAFAHEAAQRG